MRCVRTNTLGNLTPFHTHYDPPRCLCGADSDATVDGKRVSGDVTGRGIGGEETYEACHLLGRAQTTQGDGR
eukprot:24739-Eustigmatos_ZCMA.PRE.1